MYTTIWFFMYLNNVYIGYDNYKIVIENIFKRIIGKLNLKEWSLKKKIQKQYLKINGIFQIWILVHDFFSPSVL